MQKYEMTFIEAISLFDMAEKLYHNQISLKEREMLTLRNIYKQMNEQEKTFIQDKYGESVNFLEHYSGVRKRKIEDL